MSNIRMIFGKSQQSQKKEIKDMIQGEVGYTVEWAIDEKTGELNTGYCVTEKGGTACVKVTCLGNGLYDISYEKPVYRNPFTGETS